MSRYKKQNFHVESDCIDELKVALKTGLKVLGYVCTPVTDPKEPTEKEIEELSKSALKSFGYSQKDGLLVKDKVNMTSLRVLAETLNKHLGIDKTDKRFEETPLIASYKIDGTVLRLSSYNRIKMGAGSGYSFLPCKCKSDQVFTIAKTFVEDTYKKLCVQDEVLDGMDDMVWVLSNGMCNEEKGDILVVSVNRLNK